MLFTDHKTSDAQGNGKFYNWFNLLKLIYLNIVDNIYHRNETKSIMWIIKSACGGIRRLIINIVHQKQTVLVYLHMDKWRNTWYYHLPWSVLVLFGIYVGKNNSLPYFMKANSTRNTIVLAKKISFFKFLFYLELKLLSIDTIQVTTSKRM